MKNILVTGANGQLGKSLKNTCSNDENVHWYFTTSKDLDITCSLSLEDFLLKNKINYIVNCAAYTNVEKAEEEKEKAMLVNSFSVKRLAELSKENNIILIHISTDFVFDGEKQKPYIEDDITNPINIYGESKLKGEKFIQDILDDYFIIRTSWVYSEHGNNFVKTMLKLAQTKDELKVIDDQIGAPTYAKDLAIAIKQIIYDENRNFGLYNFSNLGEISWFEFAKKIFELTKNSIEVLPISSNEYKTKAQRPKFSVLNKEKIQRELNIELSDWVSSLNKSIKLINDNI